MWRTDRNIPALRSHMTWTYLDRICIAKCLHSDVWLRRYPSGYYFVVEQRSGGFVDYSTVWLRVLDTGGLVQCEPVTGIYSQQYSNALYDSSDRHMISTARLALVSWLRAALPAGFTHTSIVLHCVSLAGVELEPCSGIVNHWERTGYAQRYVGSVRDQRRARRAESALKLSADAPPEPELDAKTRALFRTLDKVLGTRT